MKISVNSEQDMKLLGKKLGAALNGGECIELIGDVGAGKTTFAKGLAEGLGITETVQSPTFTISRTYDAPNGIRLNHYDFYRLSDPGIMSEELAESLEDATTAIVIEWGDVVASVLPNDHLTVSISSPTETDRTVTVSSHGPISARLAGAAV